MEFVTALKVGYHFKKVARNVHEIFCFRPFFAIY